MRLNFLFIFIQLIALAALGQNKLVKLPIRANSNSSVSITKDSNFFVSSVNSNNICLIRADLKKIKSIQIATSLQLIVRMSTSCKDGIIVTGIVYPKNPTKFSKVWLFVVKLDTCSTPVWQKMIELKEEYLDTTITNSNPIILNVNVDDLGNIYLFSTNELSNSMKSEKTIFRNSAFIYKLSPNGELLFRKPILNRSHTNLDTKRTEFYNNHFYLTGIAFFPLFGALDTVSTTYASRGVILKIDTAGTLVNSKIVEDEPFFTNGAYGLLVKEKENKVLSWVQGRNADSTKNYRESRELIMDVNLETQKTNSSIERDSMFSFIQMFAENGKNETFVYKNWQRTAQPGRNAFTRTGYGYLHKVDSNLKTIDSSAFDFFTPSNDKDSVYNIVHILPNPLVDSVLTFFGTSNQKSSSFYYFAVNVNSKGQVIDSLPIGKLPKLSCNIDYSNSEVFLSNFDTLVITTKFNQYYFDEPNAIKETLGKEQLKLIPFPNPASSKICFNDELKINQASLYSMQGNFISHLNKENSCFKTPVFFSDGFYLLKVSLENGEVYFCKLQLQDK
jgi:hypothetical protein